jgi:adenosylcobinamide-phosphate synthase
VPDFLSLIHLIFDPSRIPVAMLALVLVAVVGVITGVLRGNTNPLFWSVTDGLFGSIGARLDRKERKAGDLVFRGFFLTVFALMFGAVVGSAAAKLAAQYPYYSLTDVVLLSLVLSGGTVWRALGRLYVALAKKKMGKGAYYTIARSSRVDLSGADDYGITRSGMGFAARAFDKTAVAPVFWFLLAGLPGAYVYAAAATLSWRFGKDGFTKGFGKTPLAFERVMGFIPDIIAGLLMALGGLFTPTGGMTRGFTGMLKKGRAPYEQGGLPVTAMAHSLNVSLGGPVTDLDGSVLKRAWVGPSGATAQLDAAHLRRALYICLMAYLLLIAALAGSMVLIS